MAFLRTGFLGTRGTFLSDLLVIIVVLLIPLFTAGYFMARNHKGSVHRVIMLTLYSAVCAYVVIYIIHVLSEGLILKFRDPTSWVYYGYWTLGLVHSAFAVGALYFGWQTVQLGRHTAKIGPNGYSLSGADRPAHKGSGKIALLCFAGAAVTGIGVYYLLFIW